MQASRRLHGQVDIDTLVRLRNLTWVKPSEFPVKRHPDVLRGLNEQYWFHEIGSEYLAANPVFVPALKPILAGAVSSDPGFSIQQSAFSTRSHQSCNAASFSRVDDPFQHLPNEIIHHLFELLDSSDIAAVRLSSRAFEQLPISLWHGLVVREMPWLYEAWSPDPTPYQWAMESARDWYWRQKAEDQFQRETLELRWEIEQYMPEALSQWMADEPAFEWTTECEEKEVLRELKPVALPRERTNWYKLYADIIANWDKLKGLQNRKRIWQDILQILDKMKKLREEGLKGLFGADLPPDPTTRNRPRASFGNGRATVVISNVL